MEPLSSEARARLAAFRSAESPDRAIADRCLAALEQRLGEPDLFDEEEAPRRPPVAPRVLAGFALAAGVLLALTWAVMRRGEGPQTGVAAPYHHAGGAEAARTAEPAARPTRDRPADVDATAEPPAGDELAELPSIKPVSSDSSKAGKRSARAEDSVAAEVDLLRRAKLAEPAERLELLEEHARRFPGGMLAAERGLLEIDARCALGQRDLARELAASYPRRFPASPLVERAANLCSSPAP